jgi:formate hydrogenlyase transcriptional activator
MTLALRTAQRYRTILEVNRAAITEPDLTEMFQGTSRTLNKVMAFDRIALSLYAPKDASLKMAAAIGQHPGSFYQVGLSLDPKDSHHGWVFQNQKPIVRRDLPSQFEFQIEQYNIKEGLRSYCAVPLIVRGESLGVMIILSSQVNQYSERHAEFLQQVANQFVLAVKCLLPLCPQHTGSKLICPRCIASKGGQTTAGKHKTRLSEWGKRGGRGRKRQPEA